MNTERIEELLRIFNENAPIARYFGMKLSFTDEVNAVIDLPYNPNLDHAFGGIHGGVYATLLDNADVSGATFTAAAAHDVSCWIATSELSIHFLEPAQRTSLRAVGRLLKHGKRQDIVEMYLYDGQGRWIGHGVGTFVVLPDVPLSPTQ
jgi:uncharacterized protein (TIGR00369 family)